MRRPPGGSVRFQLLPPGGAGSQLLPRILSIRSGSSIQKPGRTLCDNPKTKTHHGKLRDFINDMWIPMIRR